MIDYMLRFDTEQTMMDVLTSQNMTYMDEQGNISISHGSHQYALDIIGNIPPDTGYCANLRVIDDEMDTSAFEAYKVYPNKPYRVWA